MRAQAISDKELQVVLKIAIKQYIQSNMLKLLAAFNGIKVDDAGDAFR